MKKLIAIFCMLFLLSCEEQTRTDKQEIILNCKSKKLIVRYPDEERYYEVEFSQTANKGELIRRHTVEGLYNNVKTAYWESVETYAKVVCLKEVK